MRSQTVLVTGAAGKIGAAIISKFAADGAQVIAVDYREDALRESMSRVTGDITEITCDLSNSAATDALVHEAWNRVGPIDALVNVAGIVPVSLLIDMTPEDWDVVMNINLRAPMLLTRQLARLTIASGRHAAVVNISSGVVTRARPGASHYAASKAALEMLTKAAAIEFGPHLRVNAVSPGFVPVASAVNTVSAVYANSVSSNAMRRDGLPDDIANAVVWMVGPESSWITGTTLRVDGGSSAGNPALPLQNASHV